MAVKPVFKITPSVQSYDWGKIGSSSKVAQLASSGIPSFKLDESKPYAELWMGTHPTAPSLHAESHDVLSKHVAENLDLVGKPVVDRFVAGNGNLPFLFKVLSIGKALSIQTHPDKLTAEKLHAERPDVYKDDNHKPEMALALTPFTALCGFLPLDKIATYLTLTPEFAALVPGSIANHFRSLAQSRNPTGPEEKAALRDVFAAVMTAEESVFKSQLESLVARYRSGGAKQEETSVVELVQTLNEQFPGDIGVFCAFLLNYLSLNPGEAIFLGAGEPHAYVSGDIMECMANSDNVIRAGLTPKLRDIPNLVSGLTYIAGHHSKHVVQPTSFSKHSMLYDPPISEFSVVQVKLPAGETDDHRAIAGPSVVCVSDGRGEIAWGSESLSVQEGDVVFIGADKPISFTSRGQGLTLFRAFVEVE